MFSNTGTISFYLYLFFILVGLLSAMVIYRLLKNGNLEIGKIEKLVDYFKWVLVTLAVSTVSLTISDLFKERDQDVKELEYFDRYINDVKNQNDPLIRLQLVKYLSIVAPSGEMKKSWTSYYDAISKEYDDYLRAQKTIKNDTIINRTTEQIAKVEESIKKVELFETPLTTSESISEWFIVAGGDTNIEQANFELEKAIKINTNSNIIKKGNSYRTVLMGYFSKTEAENQLQIARSRINPTSYIVKKSSWCNLLETSDGYLICK